jgi:hypothetical protein
MMSTGTLVRDDGFQSIVETSNSHGRVVLDGRLGLDPSVVAIGEPHQTEVEDFRELTGYRLTCSYLQRNASRAVIPVVTLKLFCFASFS